MRRLYGLYCLFAITLLCGCEQSSPSSTNAAAGFGRFEGKIVAAWDDDGRHMTLQEPFAYIDTKNRKWFAPAGFTVDGASIPAAFWTFIGGPFEGKYRAASVVHDVGCVEMKQSWEDVHWMFYEACRCAGVGESEAKMLYYAVYHFGPRWTPVIETVVEQVQMPNGQTVEQEVNVEHAVRVDPLPPTATELAQVQAYVQEENPAPQEMQQFTREALHRRSWRGNARPRPGDSPASAGSPSASDVPGAEQASTRPSPSAPRSWQRPDGSNQQNYAEGRPHWQHQRPFSSGSHGPSYGNGNVYGNGNSGPRSGMPIPPLTPEEEQWAAGLVRQYIDAQSPEPRPANFTVERIRGGYRVLVQFLQADESGQLVPSEGGQFSVRLSRQGQIMEMVSGVQSFSRSWEAQRASSSAIR